MFVAAVQVIIFPRLVLRILAWVAKKRDGRGLSFAAAWSRHNLEGTTRLAVSTVLYSITTSRTLPFGVDSCKFEKALSPQTVCDRIDRSDFYVKRTLNMNLGVPSSRQMLPAHTQCKAFWFHISPRPAPYTSYPTYQCRPPPSPFFRRVVLSPVDPSKYPPLGALSPKTPQFPSDAHYGRPSLWQVSRLGGGPSQETARSPGPFSRTAMQGARPP